MRHERERFIINDAKIVDKLKQAGVKFDTKDAFAARKEQPKDESDFDFGDIECITHSANTAFRK